MTNSNSIIRNILIIIVLALSSALSAQDSVNTKPRKLPYSKYKTMQLIWVNFSGYAFYAPSTNDGSFSISITPNYGYYLTKNFEIVTGYSFIYTKFGSLSQINSSINHQVSLTGRFYPFRKLNFIYVESGLQAGNYTIEKISESIQRNLFSTNLMAGFGFEILPRKGKYVINFSALYAFPFNRMFKPDFIRSLGFGFVIKK